MDPKVLVIDDDERVLSLMSRYLTEQKLRVQCLNALPQLTELQRVAPDVVVVDWRFAKGSGIEWLEKLRADSRYKQLPVLMLSGRIEENDRIHALLNGADDFVCKPPSMGELEARLRNLIRRVLPLRQAYADDNIDIDIVAKRLIKNGGPVKLSDKDWAFLANLLRARCAVSKEQLIASIWGHNASDSSKRLGVLVMRLRRNIEESPDRPQYILTEKNAGYRFGGKS